MAGSFAPRSKDYYRKQGYAVFDAESLWRIPGGLPRRHDLFGFVDLVAVKHTTPEIRLPIWNPDWEPETRIVLVQPCAWNGIASHRRKILTELEGHGQWALPMRDIARWLLHVPGLRIEIQGWKLEGNRYVNKIVPLTLEDVC